MASWVRYSVAAYLGLLISGTVAHPPWEPAGPEVPIDYPEAHRPSDRAPMPTPPRDDQPSPIAAAASRSATLVA